MELKKYAIVPARGGSQRLVGKNIREFHGKPIIQWVLDTLRSADLFDRVIVSTDDKQIANIVRGLGYEVPFIRPGHLATDTASTAAVVNHAIAWLIANGASEDGQFLTAYPTAVMSTAEHIRSARELLEPGVCDFVFSAAEFPSHIERAWRLLDDGWVSAIDEGSQSVRSQDLEVAYFDAGQFYWSTYDSWPESPSVVQRRRMFRLDLLDAIDINTEDDWTRAEQIFAMRRGREIS